MSPKFIGMISPQSSPSNGQSLPGTLAVGCPVTLLDRALYSWPAGYVSTNTWTFTNHYGGPLLFPSIHCPSGLNRFPDLGSDLPRCDWSLLIHHLLILFLFGKSPSQDRPIKARRGWLDQFLGVAPIIVFSTVGDNPLLSWSSTWMINLSICRIYKETSSKKKSHPWSGQYS